MSTAYHGTSIHDRESDLGLTWYAREVAATVRDASVLELGIGYGMTTPILAEAASRHVVVEGEASVIERFRGLHPGCPARVVHGFFEEFATDERFDAVVMGFVLEHVDDPELLLRRYAKFLKPGGCLWVAVPNARSLHRLIGAAAGFLDDVHALSDFDRKLGHRRYYDYSSLIALLGSCGYRVTVAKGIFLKPLTSSQLESLNLDDRVFRAFLIVGKDLPELANSILVRCERTNHE